jgi:hypothetical protein
MEVTTSERFDYWDFLRGHVYGGLGRNAHAQEESKVGR